MASFAKHVSFAPSVTSYVFYKSALQAVDIETSPLQDHPLLTVCQNHRLRLFFHHLATINHQASSVSAMTQDQLDSLLSKCDLLFDRVMRSKTSFAPHFHQMRQGKLLPEPLRVYLDALVQLESELSLLKVTILLSRCLNK